MGAVKIHITTGQYQQVAEGRLSMNDLLGRLLFDTEIRQHILEQLQNYHSDEDGAPIVPDFDIAGVSFDTTTCIGKLRLNYRVDYTFACADHRSTTKNTETSNLTYDPQTQILSISIHDKISRDTVDEF